MKRLSFRGISGTTSGFLNESFQMKMQGDGGSRIPGNKISAHSKFAGQRTALNA